MAFTTNHLIAEQQGDSQGVPAPTHTGLLFPHQNQVRNLLAPSGTWQVEYLRRYLDVAAKRDRRPKMAAHFLRSWWTDVGDAKQRQKER